MKLPCELIVTHILPTARGALAKELVNRHNMTQVQVAGLFGVTSAAVSQYLKGFRGGHSGLEIHEGSWEILPVFKMLEKWGGVPHREMFNIFNMGIGMIAVMDAADAPKAISILEAHGEKASVIGKVTDTEGVNIY